MQMQLLVPHAHPSHVQRRKKPNPALLVSKNPPLLFLLRLGRTRLWCAELGLVHVHCMGCQGLPFNQAEKGPEGGLRQGEPGLFGFNRGAGIFVFGRMIIVGVAYAGPCQNGALIRENSCTLKRDFIDRLGPRPL